MKTTMMATVSLFLAIVGLTIVATSVDADTSDDWMYSLEEDGAVIDGYAGTDAEIYIPYEIGGKPVVAIGTNAFLKNKTIVSVSIPSTVREIRDSAFDRSSVSTVVFEDEGLDFIGNQAFYKCTELVSIEFPESLQDIAKRAFKGCTSLENVKMPSKMNKIAAEAFSTCTSLKSITIPAEANVNSENVFNGCTSLLEVIVDEDVSYISSATFPNHRFYSVDGEPLTDRNGLKGRTFHGVSTEVMVADQPCMAYFISDGEVFGIYDGPVGTPIVVPDEEPRRAGHTFVEWKGYIEGMLLTCDIVFEAVFDINSYTITFMADGETVSSDRYEYGTVIVPPEAPDKEGYDFVAWSGFTEGMTVTRNMTFYAEYDVEKYMVAFLVDGEPYSISYKEYGALIIPPGSPEKEGYTFVGWKDYVRGMTVPDHSVTFDAMFEALVLTLTTVVLGEVTETPVQYGDIPDLPAPSVEGYNFDGWYLDPAYSEEYIPEPVSDDLTLYARMVPADPSGSCGRDLFWTMSNDGVLTIYGTGDMYSWDFSTNIVPWYGYRSEIMKVVVCEGATSIGRYAFHECDSLVSVSIPFTLNSISDGAFFKCYSLVEVFNDSPLKISPGHSDNGHIARYAVNIYSSFEGGSILYETVDDDGYVYIFMDRGDIHFLVKSTKREGDVFLSDALCDGTAYTLGVYQYAFYGCSSLRTVTSPYVTAIDSYAFQDCTSLYLVDMPALRSIGTSAFYNCMALTYVSSTCIEVVGATAFFRCSSLEMLDLPMVEYIGNYAFSRCSSLREVDLPSVSSIGDTAFSGCTSLIRLSIGDVSDKGIGAVSMEILGAGETVSYYFVPARTGTMVVTTAGSCDTYGMLVYADGTFVMDDDSGDMRNFMIVFDAVAGIGYTLEVGTYSVSDDNVFWTMFEEGTFVCPLQSTVYLGNGAFQNCTSLEYVSLGPAVSVIGRDVFNGLVFMVGGSVVEPTCDNLAGRTFTGNGDQVLRAENPDVHTVTFYFGKYNLVYTLVHGSPVELPAPVPSDIHSDGNVLVFNGWNGYHDGMVVESDLVFTPSFKVEGSYEVTVIYGDGSSETLYVSPGETVVPSKPVHRFYLDEERNVSWPSSSKVFHDLVLYADAYYSGAAGETAYWSLDLSTGTLRIYGEGKTYNWSVKTTPWYQYRGSITSVVIDEGITSLGSYAVYKYSHVTDITVSDTVEHVGKYALVSYVLEHLRVGSGLSDLGLRGFHGMTLYDNGNERTVKVDNLRSKEYMGMSGALDLVAIRGIAGDLSWTIDCNDKTLIVYGEGSTGNWTATSAPWYQYRGYFENVFVGKGVTEIGDFAFYSYSKVKTVVFGDDVVRIGKNCIRGCPLEKVTFGDGLSVIGSNALTGYVFMTMEGKELKPSVKNLASHTFVGNGGSMVRVV
ncbi:MAG: leucine-rich repeat protein [archaeon]|nr:leucine-rich repeat protein [archaeon]